MRADSGASPRPVLMTVAGSDSGGGAGIQADLLTFARLGAFGTSAITCVTAQNPDGVRAVVPLTPGQVLAQIEAVLEAFGLAGAKTGMLYSREIIDLVAAAAGQPGFPPPVVDPVMVAASGARLLREDAVTSYVERLCPRAALATPNLEEAAVLLGRPVASGEDMPEAARSLSGALRCPVLLKGGHLGGDLITDVLFDGVEIHVWKGPRLTGVNTHGTGCTLSAAIAARLAHGDGLAAACQAGREFVRRAIAHPVELRDASAERTGRIVLGDGSRDEP